MTQNVRNTDKTSEDVTSTKVEGATRKSENVTTSKAGSGGAFTVTLGFSSLMTALTALVGCVVVAFMMGVIVGRDDVSSRPTLAQIAEEQDAAVAAALAAAKKAVQKEPQQGAQASADGDNNDKPETVMSPEELKYATALKGKNATATVKKAAPTPPPAPAVTTSVASVAVQASTQNTPSQGAAPATTVDAATALYDFEYQVASLKDEGAVDRLRAKLEGEGLRTRMSKIGGYLKVSVHMRGTTAQGQALEQRMVELKLGKPVLQQKKAVP